jgi:phosphatidylcholine synthase
MNIQKIDKDKIAAWAVHSFTASGAVLGFLAIISILDNDLVGAFLWLGLALFIDGIDGTIARKIGVTNKTPNIDGSTLDNVIDYLNYVIIPAIMIYWFQLVPEGWEIILPAGMFAVSLYTFANMNMKTSDYYFSGFPAVWNIVVLYFFILGSNNWLDGWINVGVIIFFFILTFIPIKFVHPLRVKKLRNLTIFATIIWSATTLKLVTSNSEINLFYTEKIVMSLWILCSIYFAIICSTRSFGDIKDS